MYQGDDSWVKQRRTCAFIGACPSSWEGDVAYSLRLSRTKSSRSLPVRPEARTLPSRSTTRVKGMALTPNCWAILLLRFNSEMCVQEAPVCLMAAVHAVMPRKALIAAPCYAGYAVALKASDAEIKEYFLVPEDKDECRFYQAVSSMMRAFDRQKGHKAYTILPTYSCNARCMYCYEEGRLPVTMTPEIVGKTIQFILDSRSDDKVHLEWFGGEPLLCPEIIDRICLEIGKAGIEYTSSMISNGSLITSEKIEKMTTTWKMKHVQISMDCAETVYPLSMVRTNES